MVGQSGQGPITPSSADYR